MTIQITLDTEKKALAALLTAGTSDYSPVMVTENDNAQADERALIKKSQRSDARAFEALYKLHIDRVYGICLRMTGNASEAEDCAQEAFIQAWNKMDKFRGDSAFSTWLHRIAVNSVLGRIRKAKREQDRITAVSDTALSTVATGETGEMKDLSEAVNRLPEGARNVFVLHAIYGYSHIETGEMLGIATGTSKAQLHRAKRLLAQQLKQQGFDA